MKIIFTILSIIFQIIIFLLGFIFEISCNDEKDQQLDQLNDGLGSYIADGEHYTEEEIKVIKSRGELYDTYL